MSQFQTLYQKTQESLLSMIGSPTRMRLYKTIESAIKIRLSSEISAMAGLACTGYGESLKNNLDVIAPINRPLWIEWVNIVKPHKNLQGSLSGNRAEARMSGLLVMRGMDESEIVFLSAWETESGVVHVNPVSSIYNIETLEVLAAEAENDYLAEDKADPIRNIVDGCCLSAIDDFMMENAAFLDGDMEAVKKFGDSCKLDIALETPYYLAIICMLSCENTDIELAPSGCHYIAKPRQKKFNFLNKVFLPINRSGKGGFIKRGGKLYWESSVILDD